MGRNRYQMLQGLRSRQRGSFVVTASIFLSLAVIMLASIDVGNLYFQRRSLQQIADTSALAGVQTLSPTDTTCGTSHTTVMSIAGKNDTNAVSTATAINGTDQVTDGCGRWDVQANSAPTYYTAAPSSQTPLNAVKVTLTRKMHYYFLGAFRFLGAGPATISATATARASQVDVFSVSSTLANLNTSNSPILDALLTGLLGSSANVNVGLVGYQALASANVTLNQLATAAVNLGEPGTSNPPSVGQLLGLKLTVSQLLSIAASAVGSSSTVGTQLTALGADVGTTVNANAITVGNLLQFQGSNAQSAGTANINLLQYLLATAQMGAYNSGLTLSVSTSQCPTSTSAPLCSLLSGLSGLAQINSLQIQVLSPPSIGIGEAGQFASGLWRTEAAQGEIGINVDIGVLSNPPAIGIPLVASVQLSGVHLPLSIVLGGPGRAWLATTSCGSTAATSTATFGGLPGAALICAGTGSTISPTNTLTQPTCSSSSAAIPVAALSGTILGIPISLLQVSLTLNNAVAYIGSSTPVYSGPPLPATAGSLSNSLPITSSSQSSTALTSTGSIYDAQNGNQYTFCNINPSNSNYQTCNLSGWSIGPNWTTSSTATNSLNVQLNNVLGAVGSTQVSVLGLNVTLLNAILSPVTSLLASTLQTLVNPLLNSLVTPLLSGLGLQVGVLTVTQNNLTCNAPQIVY